MRHIKQKDPSLRYLSIFAIIASVVVIARLFALQILDHNYYAAMALDAHEIYTKLVPHRGAIYFQDTRTKEQYPAAVNREYYLVYAVPRDIPMDQVFSTAQFLAAAVNLSEENKILLFNKLSQSKSQYAVVAKKVDEQALEKIKSANLKGINYISQEFRYYPEHNLASNVLGFTVLDDSGAQNGKYGVEGFLNYDLAGKNGFLAGERGATGGIISLAGGALKPAENGADITLTIDRNLEYNVCNRLKQGFLEYHAKNASLILMDPTQGNILAMCSFPDFDPNNYSQVKDVGDFNNTAIFTAYEPGSVFKAITMAIALDLNLVTPYTTFFDTGEKIVNGHKIHNALDKKYGLVTMTNALEESINTALIWVSEKLGQNNFKKYADVFGFGKKTGVELDTDSAGDISSFTKNAEVYLANASFGQGFTATPLQIVTAYATLANGGRMPKPYIVDHVKYPNGRVETTEPQITDTVISPRASQLITGMLVSVVENGHGKKARQEHYYVAGKTGTGQIAEHGVYTDKTNHTFVGYFPADKPRFVLLVKYEDPNKPWAEETTLPVFKDVTKFTLDYFGIPGER